MRNATIVVIACLVLTACASGGGRSTTQSPRDPDRISPEEIQSQPAGSAYDAVQRLRPNWLRGRAATLAGGNTTTVHLPAVFVDNVYFGSLQTLRQFNLDSVDEILFSSASEATTRYGTGYLGGVIHVRTKRSSLPADRAP